MSKRNIAVKAAPVTDVAVKKQQQPIKQPKKHRKLFVTCGVLIILAVTLLVCFLFASQNFANQYLAEGNQKFDDHLYTKANEDYLFASALSFFSPKTSSQAYEKLGEVANLRGDHELAAKYFEKALTKKSSDVLHQKYAEELFALQEYSDAETQALKIQNPNDDAIFLLGHAALRQDNFDQAKKYFEKLSGADVNEAAKNQHLAWFALRDHSEEFLSLFPKNGEIKFKTYAEKALKSPTYSAVDYVTLGNFLLQVGESDFALDFASSALAIENNYRDAFTLRAQAHAERKEYAEAQKSLDEALVISPLNEDLWYIQGQLDEDQEEHADAFVAYKKAEELGQDSALFHFNFAKVARENKDYDSALSEAKKALKLDREADTVYLQFIFWTALDAKNYQTMQDVAKQYSESHPKENFGVLAEAYAGYKLQERSNFSDVVADVQKDSPQSAFAKYLEGIDSMDQHRELNKTKTRILFETAIDYDTNAGSDGEVARHAQMILDTL
jgi:tetratricopeptide (TPR) repeat protein